MLDLVDYLIYINKSTATSLDCYTQNDIDSFCFHPITFRLVTKKAGIV